MKCELLKGPKCIATIFCSDARELRQEVKSAT